MNAQDYAELIKKILSSFQYYLEDGPRFPFQIKIPQDNPSFLQWKADICLRDNLCLSVNEVAIFEDDEMVERSFAYHFWDRGKDRMIWRIDNHGRRDSVLSRCHVHTNPDDQNERNEFYPDSKVAIFPYVISCVRKHYEEHSQDWEVSTDDATE